MSHDLNDPSANAAHLLKLAQSAAAGDGYLIIHKSLAEAVANQLIGLSAEYRKNFRLLCDTEKMLAEERRKRLSTLSSIADQGVQRRVASVPRSVPEEDTAEYSRPGEATG